MQPFAVNGHRIPDPTSIPLQIEPIGPPGRDGRRGLDRGDGWQLDATASGRPTRHGSRGLDRGDGAFGPDGEGAVPLGPVRDAHFDGSGRGLGGQFRPLGRETAVPPTAGHPTKRPSLLPLGGLEPHGGGHRGVSALGRREGGGPARIDPLDEVGGGVAGQEGLRAERGRQEVAVGGHPANVQSLQGQGQSSRRLGPAGGVGDDLGQHRVEVEPDFAAGLDAAVPPHGRVHRGSEGSQGAHCGQEAGRRVLGIEAGLDGVARESDVGLGVAQRLAGGDPQLLADQVDSRHLLGDRVLHLQAGVHLQEEELAGVVVDQQLHRPRRDVADRPGQPHRGVAHGGPQGIVDRDGRRLLDDLLVAALDGALPLTEMDDIAVGIAQDLDLHMAAPAQVALQEHGVIAEAAQRLAPGSGHGLGEVGRIRDQAHALAAPASGRLDHEREADIARVAGVIGRRQRGHACSRGRGLGRQLVAHGLDGIGTRADPHQAGGGHRPGEAGVLGQEAVAGMHGVGAGRDRGGHQSVAVEVAAGQPQGHVRLGHKRGIGVGVGVHGHAAHAHGPGGAEHPSGDLTTVRHQQRPDPRHTPLPPELAAECPPWGTKRCQIRRRPNTRRELAAECPPWGTKRCQIRRRPNTRRELAAECSL